MTYPVATIVFVALIAFVIVLGFVAGRWKAGNMNHIEEWGLGGRRFGTLISWFLIGGDAYTAYTFIAIPALMFGAGAIGFFAVPYTVVCYPILFLVFPKLWKVARNHGYITGPEFVRGRYGNRWLALAIGVTGIIATMPYIALQLIGMQTIIGALGIPGHIPLIAAFAVLAAFTYTSGLRAPAMISIVKEFSPIYLTVIVAVIVIPSELGGFGAIFAHVAPAKLRFCPRRPPAAPGLHQLRDAGPRFGHGPVPVPAYHHGHSQLLRAAGDQAQCGTAAGLYLRARPAGLARLHGGGRGPDENAAIRRGLRPIPCQFRDSGADALCVPGLVRRRGLRRHRDRRPGAGGDHVHRLGEHLHP